jgi:hypothetical protein
MELDLKELELLVLPLVYFSPYSSAHLYLGNMHPNLPVSLLLCLYPTLPVSLLLWLYPTLPVSEYLYPKRIM